MKKTKSYKRILTFLLCVALLVSYIPLTTAAATPLAPSAVAGVVTDQGTADSWEHMMGTDVDGNRYSGRVWVDKSVYKDGDIAVLNSKNQVGSQFQVSLEDDEAFQMIFSALGSTMSEKNVVSTTGPLDVVLILDNSVSMNTVSGGTTRMQKVIEAANKLLGELLNGHDVRLGIAAYSQDASTVLPFGIYDDVVLKVNNYTGQGSSNGVITAYNSANQVINSNYKSGGYANYTNTQAGFDLGMEMLAEATNTANRKPVVILLTDGAANTAVDTLFHNNRTGTVRQVYYSNDIDPMIALSTLLSAAFNKATVEDHYGIAPMVYGVGVDLSSTDGSNAIIDPAKNFNADNVNNHIEEAYEVYTQTWLAGRNVEITSGTGSGWMGTNYTFRFGHEYPQGSNVTNNDIAANINYVDTYYPVAGANLESVFDQIYEELFSGAFNPISSSSVVDGATGVDNTPLIYVDFIGQYMEIKEIQAVTLFGSSYGVVKNANGTYTVTEAIGKNPTTNENWNTAEDILISVIEQPDGTQKLEIKINQEILPIIVERVEAETVGNVTSATITELLQDPLRVYYTVGIDSDILLPNGEIDVSQIQGYGHIDNTNGTISFYGGQFGVKNTAADSNGNVIKGDAHVGFKPSGANRYYYHQTNQGIFTEITNKSDGSPVTISPNNEYGIVWDETQYDLTWMSYADYLAAADTDMVYTYVTYYRPTSSNTDIAEEVTYLVYMEWKYLKESVAFYDAHTETYLNGGAAIDPAQVATVIAAYEQNNPNAELYAVLGTGSMRTSRLHNMTVVKEGSAPLLETAVERYTPEYTRDTASQHSGNDVVVWLGNNGKLTVEIDTGIALTKSVTEAIGNADDTYALTVTVPSGVTANPVVLDADGNTVSSTYSGNVLTVNVKAGQTVYVSGIPGGTICAIDEIISSANADKYRIESKTNTVRVPLVSEVLAGAVAQFAPAMVTNAPYEYGNLFITKEIISDHTVPGSIQDTVFDITVNVGTGLTGKTFTVQDSAQTAPYVKTVDASGNMTFQIKAKQTIEILDLPEGTAATVTEANPGSHFTVSYRTRNHSGETADADNALVIPADGSATAVVMNNYIPSPVASVSLAIAGTKNFTAESTHPGGEFVYEVQKWNGTDWDALSGKTAVTPYAAGEIGTKNFTISNVLENEVALYNKVGSHVYRVVEVKGNVSNVTYDRTVYAFDVIITDNDGQLVAEIKKPDGTSIPSDSSGNYSYDVTFNNTYHTAPASIEIVKKVDNKSGDNTVSKAGFEFKAVRTDGSWNPLTGSEASTLNVVSDAAGRARLAATYTAEGTYYYVLNEVEPANSAQNHPGWAYSDAEYRITVDVDTVSGSDLVAELTIDKHVPQGVADNAQETASVNGTDKSKGEVCFWNTYDPEDVTIDLDGGDVKVSKVLTGKTLEDDQFTFYVYHNNDRSNPILVGKNKQNGSVHFVDFNDVLTLSSVGRHEFDIVESIPAGAVDDLATGKKVLNGMSYDPTIYDLVVEVTNDIVTGKLVADYYFEDAVGNEVTFYNSYEATPTKYALGGTKVLHGRAPQNREFSFELYEGNVLKQTVTNKSDGSFLFDEITYTEAGIHTYTIKEVEPDDAHKAAGVRYDGADPANDIGVTVTVTDTSGVLSAAATISNAAIKFENTYTASPALVTFNGTKQLAGGTLTDNAFTFNLYKTDSSFDITGNTAVLLDSSHNVGGAFTLKEEFNSAGVYFLVVAEDVSAMVEDVVYDRTEYQFAVRVSDIGDGQLKAVVTNVHTGSSSAPAASTSADVAFTNATFDEVTEKEVYHAGATTTEIDGKKVNAGDILTYFIIYTNYTGEDVVVDILDTIPDHTSYVDGSASHNGTYAGSHVNWVLNVTKGDSVTVSFDVKVEETEAIVANTAVVLDGVNTYNTNAVVNHTVENALVKDVFAPTDTTVSIDGDRVYEGNELLYKISYTNASRDAVDVRITDVIPENTTYVAGSADNGGVFADGKLVWDIDDIPAWSTVTVTFKVTVNANIGAVTIKNQATAAEGTNSYETEVVSNFTVVEPTPTPTPNPDPNPEQEPDPTPEPTPEPSVGSAKTGDQTPLAMYLILCAVALGGMAAVLVKRYRRS